MRMKFVCSHSMCWNIAGLAGYNDIYMIYGLLIQVYHGIFNNHIWDIMDYYKSYMVWCYNMFCGVIYRSCSIQQAGC
jgi:hypothetical protein